MRLPGRPPPPQKSLWALRSGLSKAPRPWAPSSLSPTWRDAGRGYLRAARRRRQRIPSPASVPQRCARPRQRQAERERPVPAPVPAPGAATRASVARRAVPPAGEPSLAPCPNPIRSDWTPGPPGSPDSAPGGLVPKARTARLAPWGRGALGFLLHFALGSPRKGKKGDWWLLYFCFFLLLVPKGEVGGSSLLVWGCGPEGAQELERARCCPVFCLPPPDAQRWGNGPSWRGCWKPRCSSTPL